LPKLGSRGTFIQYPEEAQEAISQQQNEYKPGTHNSQRIDVSLEKWSNFVATFKDNCFLSSVKACARNRQSVIGDVKKAPKDHSWPSMFKKKVRQKPTPVVSELSDVLILEHERMEQTNDGC
jgi:hypothetical protein